MHFNLEVNYLLDPAHLEIRASCEKKAKPKKRFLEEAHCHRISDASKIGHIWAKRVLVTFSPDGGARETENMPTHQYLSPLHSNPCVSIFEFPVHFRSMHFWTLTFDFMHTTKRREGCFWSWKPIPWAIRNSDC